VDGAALLLKPLREPAASYWLNIVRGAESTRPQKRVKAANWKARSLSYYMITAKLQSLTVVMIG
jgi:hypothetical protein